MILKKKSKDMWTSVSAITDADDCMRRWWFNKEIKLPQPQRAATIFGDVTHAVCERYLRADDTGLVDGMPVDIYPVNWMTMHNRFDKTETKYTISNEEAALIKTLITEAIVKGVLVREPGRVIEKDISCIIHTVGYAKVVLRGFIDLDTPRGIIDHKTAKSTKYILSKKKLKESIQMMGYAFEKFQDGHQGALWLTHNNFIKDFTRPQVIQRSVQVVRPEVMEFFNIKILPLVKKMMRYHLDYPKTMVHKWRDLPGANNPDKSCNHHYGHPCPYIGICSGTCTIDNYLRPYGLTVNQLVGNTKDKPKGKLKMAGLLDKIKKQNEGPEVVAVVSPEVVPPAVATPTQTLAVPPSLVPAVVDTPVAVGTPPNITVVPAPLSGLLAGTATDTPVISVPAPITAPAPTEITKQEAPWYTPPCIACKDSDILGYNTNMNPCNICVLKGREIGKPGPDDYDVDVQEGVVIFTLKPEVMASVPVVAPVPVSIEVAPQPEVKTEMSAEATAPLTAKLVPDNFPLNTPTPTVESVVAAPTGIQNVYKPLTPPETVTDNPITPAQPVGFTMLIGCTHLNPPANVLNADNLVKDTLTVIAHQANKADASAIEHFALMQAIDAYVSVLVPTLVGRVIVSLAPSKGSAHARLIDGLRLHASTVIYPFAI